MVFCKRGLCPLVLTLLVPGAYGEFNASVGVETWAFAHEGAAGQDRLDVAASAEPEYRTEWNHGDDRLVFEGFLRLDGQDSERTHGDLRSLYWHHLAADWDLRVGLDRVFWGVTEFTNPADMVNQTDLVEDPDGDAKLGQPMIRWTWLATHGTLDVLALPGFRERTFAGEDGRFRTIPPVNADAAQYESGAHRHRLDGAIRYRFTWQQTDWALSHFSGTSRDPVLVPRLTPSGAEIIPYYPVIDQTALTLQSARGRWLWKLEAVSASGPVDRHTTATGGFEVTQYNVAETGWDIGWITEYLFDDRRDDMLVPFERDWFFGARWQLNDIQSSEALFGVVWDPVTEERIFSLEASRRLGRHYSLDLEARVFTGGEGLSASTPTISSDNKLGYLQRDDYLRVQVSRYF
ncbi:hypothetical protein QQM79_02260 [Marinobacteraceae bacterium S3BR75-40.1]